MENSSGFLGKISKRIVGIANPKPKEPIKPSLVVPSTTDQFQPSYQTSDFLNESALDREFSVLLIDLQTLYEKAPNISTSTEDDAIKLDALSEKIVKATKLSDDKTIEFHEKLTQRNVTIEELAIRSALRTGIALVIEDAINTQLDFINQQANSSKYQLESFFKLYEFHWAGWLAVGIGGVSIKDLMDNKQNISPASVLKLLMESQLVKQDISHDMVLKENTDSLQRKHPNITKNYIEMATADINGATRLPIDKLYPLLSTSKGLEKESVQRAIRFVERLQMLQQTVVDTVGNPESSDFPLVKQTLEDYLKLGWRDRMLAIYMLGLKDILSARDLYRKARKFEIANNNPDFYHLLTNSMLEFFEALSSNTMLTKNDTLLFLEKERNGKAQTLPNYEDLAIINGLTFQKSSEKQYDIAVDGIKWQILVPPTQASIKFSEGGPRRFTVSLRYKNQEGEIADLNVTFDTKKGEFDWSFLESPNDPEMKEMKDAVMLATKEILLDVQRQATEEWQEKQRAKAQTVIVNGTNQKKTSSPHVPRAKEKKPERQLTMTPLQEALGEPITLSQDNKIKRHVDLPPKDTLRDMMKGISPENQTLISNKLEGFNTHNIGEFKPLPPRLHNNKPVYELKSGDFRILMVEMDRINGEENDRVHHFEIFKIENRREIFNKKHKLSI